MKQSEYRIPGYFRGMYISRLCTWSGFLRFNFHGYLLAQFFLRFKFHGSAVLNHKATKDLDRFLHQGLIMQIAMSI